jgi:hypothetical protein
MLFFSVGVGLACTCSQAIADFWSGLRAPCPAVEGVKLTPEELWGTKEWWDWWLSNRNPSSERELE